jgi:uncharacterized protein YkwD
MKKLITISAIVLAVCLSAGGAYAYFSSSITPVTKAVATFKPEAVNKSDLLSLMNVERVKAHKTPLVESSDLDESAQFKANDMTKYNYFNHVSPHDGKHGYQYIPIQCKGGSGENLIAEDGITAPIAINGWMRSTGHRDLMLNKSHDLVGFGISGGNIVAHFCNR